MPGEDVQIELTLGEVTNPLSVQEVDGLKIVIYAFGKYAIDEFEGQIGWELTHGGFVDAKVVPDKMIAYADNTNYVISFTPEHIITQNGYIDVEFPPEVTIPDESYSQSSCVADETSGFPT